MPGIQVSRLIYKNFVWRFFFYFTSLLLNIAIARILGAEISGNFNFFLNDLSFFLLIGSLSLESGIIYYVSKNESRETLLASFSVIWTALASGIISAMFYLFYSDQHGIFSGSFLVFSCITYLTGIFLTTYFTAFFYSRDNYKAPNVVLSISNLLLFLFICGQSLRGIVNIKLFFFLFFMFSILQGVVIAGIWFIQNGYSVKMKPVKLSSLSPVLVYSLKALIGNIAYFLLYRIDYWFVEYYCSAKALGNYIQVSKVGQMLVLPLVIMGGTLFPQSSKDNISFGSPVFKKILRIVSIIYLTGALFTLIVGKQLIFFVWGNDYDEMYFPLLLMLPGIIFLAISYIFSPIFAGKGKVEYNVYISLVTLAVVIVFNFLLIPGWGIQGAALATSVGFLMMMILYVIIANKKMGMSLK